MKEGAGHRPKLGNPNLENTILNVPSIIMIMLKCLTMITNHRCILLNKYDISTFTMHIFIYAVPQTFRVHIYIYMHMYTDICRWVCVSMYVCLFVCLFVCISVCLSVGTDVPTCVQCGYVM